ncbi:MAG: archaetidylserine decarboxylase [Pseudomonadota bacterium]
MVAGIAIPKPLRTAVLGFLAAQARIELGEAEYSLEEYSSLDAFFTRRLKPGSRSFPSDPGVVGSPCDGIVCQSGVATAGDMLQAKGKRYSLEALFEDAKQAAQFVDGCYVTIYLSPRNYHRVHFAAKGIVTGCRHIPGGLWPVNPRLASRLDGLFAKNERVVTYQDTGFGRVATVMIGAAGVGSIELAYCRDGNGSTRQSVGQLMSFVPGVAVNQGDELGVFHLGSTVVMIFEPGAARLEPLVPGQPICLGTPIARAPDGRGRSVQ